MTRKICAYITGGIALVAVSLPLTLSSSYAQNPPVQQGQGNQRFGQRGGAGQDQPFAGPRDAQRGGGFGGMMGGGQATMVVSGNFLFILRGNQLLKVDANTLRVVAQGELPGQQMPGGNRGGGNPSQDQGGGRNIPPPPPTK